MELTVRSGLVGEGEGTKTVHGSMHRLNGAACRPICCYPSAVQIHGAPSTTEIPVLSLPLAMPWIQGCNLWRNRVKLLSFSENLIQPYLEGMRRTGTGLLWARDFLRVKLDDLWLPVQKSSTSVRQRSGRCWHPARVATGCEQNGGNLNQLRHKLQPCMDLFHIFHN